MQRIKIIVLVFVVGFFVAVPLSCLLFSTCFAQLCVYVCNTCAIYPYRELLDLLHGLVKKVELLKHFKRNQHSWDLA